MFIVYRVAGFMHQGKGGGQAADICYECAGQPELAKQVLPPEFVPSPKFVCCKCGKELPADVRETP